MALVTDANTPEPTVPSSSSSSYPTPSQSDLAAVAATVSVVGIVMAVLVTWLVFRLRRTPDDDLPRPTSYAFRPSFAPSEASSKFGFIRKPLRLSHRHKADACSWDFADPDPFAHPKESGWDALPPPRHRPPPLTSVPAYAPRAHKDEPTTPDIIDPPPPAYCRD